MKKLKKIFAIVLALVMVMAMAVPAMAAGPHTITITENTPGREYAAYQIFAGEIENLNGSAVLTEITWGKGINSTEFLAALKSSTLNPTYYSLYANAGTAADVAKILGDNNALAHAQAFAALADNYLSDVYDVSTASDPFVRQYTIEVEESGYYLIKDIKAVEGATDTDFILKLVEDVTITPKDGNVTVDKYILEGENLDTAIDTEIGKPVDFELHGTLPINYGLFNEFSYTFVDTLSPGLTYDADKAQLVVEFDNGGLMGDGEVVDPEHYEVIVSDVLDDAGNDTGKTELKIIFEDLKELEKLTDDSGNKLYNINGTTRIFASYYAFLNEDAVIGNPGNPNEVYVLYTRNTDNGGTGRTTTDIVHVFTYALDVIKTDGKTNATLAGVGFKLLNSAGQFAKVGTILDDENNVIGYNLDGWGTEEEASTIYTAADGTFTVNGVSEGVYFLRETEPLPGYDPIDDIRFVIESDINDETQVLEELLITVTGQQPKPGDIADGSVDLAIVNNPGHELPSTGGIGTTLFYVFGGIMVLAAVVLLVTKKRMHN